MDKLIEKVEEVLDWGGIKKQVVFLIISALALVLSFFDLPLHINPSWIAIILCGIPIVLEALIGLIESFDIKAGVLVSLALVASVCIGEDFAAGEVAFIMQLGELLEHLTVKKARAGIERLIKLTPRTARIIKDGKEEIIPAEKVCVGDIIRVLPGETVPVDGVIISGQTSVNQAVMTGEAIPVDKEKGDKVFSGTVNQFGAFEMKAEKVGKDSSVQRMIELVKSADSKKAKIVGIADRWATYVVVIALLVAILAWVITGDIIRAVTVLVVFCPCALVLATPTAIMAAMGNAAKRGFLVREGDALERLSKVSKIAIDKTGTITHGRPEVVLVKSVSEYEKEEIYKYAASAEMLSEHPLGKALLKYYKKEMGDEIISPIDFKMEPGKGVSAKVDGKEIKAGSLSFVGSIKIPEAEEHLEKGSTVIYVSLDSEIAGFIVLSDKIRKESPDVIRELEKLGISSVLLTGDGYKTAENIASQVGIKEFKANLLPEDKLSYVEKAQGDGYSVCMIGDGINDAPALKRADVGIAMGGVGSDITAEAASIVLATDEIKEITHIIRLSRKMLKTIKLNFAFSMGLNFLAIILATMGTLNPVVGALVHNLGSVAVIINSALLLKWNK